jgi:hypothetical protein
MSLSVTFERSLEDQWEWLEHKRKKLNVQPPLRLVAILAILGWLALNQGWDTIAWIFMGLAAFMVLAPALGRWQTNSLRQQLATMKPKNTQTLTVSLEEKGLSQAEPHLSREVLFYWSALKAVTDLEKLIGVELEHKEDGEETAVALPPILIPKRAFETPEACAAFLALLQGKMPSGETQETPAGEP